MVLSLVDVTTQYDVVFCFGDFNFRLTEDRESVMATLYHHTGDNMDVLLQHDQLSKEMDKGQSWKSIFFSSSPEITLQNHSSGADGLSIFIVLQLVYKLES